MTNKEELFFLKSPSKRTNGVVEKNVNYQQEESPRNLHVIGETPRMHK